ncbi:DUF6207 family protein [Streptomyces chartreusis]|uniref:DUF6207 family protein n=1 Tax=Streptomyces chartreusis TaxID=1969 RepID=UPI00343F74F4
MPHPCWSACSRKHREALHNTGQDVNSTRYTQPGNAVVVGQQERRQGNACQATVGLCRRADLDDETVLALQKVIVGTWATITSESTFRDPGQPGVRQRL